MYPLSEGRGDPTGDHIKIIEEGGLENRGPEGIMQKGSRTCLSLRVKGSLGEGSPMDDHQILGAGLI